MKLSFDIPKRLALGVFLALSATSSLAAETGIEKLKIPFSETSLSSELSSSIYQWDHAIDKKEVLHELLIIDGLKYAQSGNWKRFTADSISEVERALGEQIPARHDLVRWYVDHKGEVYYHVMAYVGDYSTRAKGLPNRVIMAVDKQSGKVVMYNDWDAEGIERVKKARQENDADITQISDGLKRYIDGELAKEKPFKNSPDVATANAREMAKMISATYDANIPFAQKPQPFRAPYLWGRLEMTTQLRIDGSRHYVDNFESFDLDYSKFKATFFANLFDIEDYLGYQIPLREQQVRWLHTPDKTYFILIENPERYGVQYETVIYAYDGTTHESFMTILWNNGEKDD